MHGPMQRQGNRQQETNDLITMQQLMDIGADKRMNGIKQNVLSNSVNSKVNVENNQITKIINIKQTNQTASQQQPFLQPP